MCGDLGLPRADLHEITGEEIYLLQQSQMDQYDLLAQAIRIGHAYLNDKKLARHPMVDMFGRSKRKNLDEMSQSERSKAIQSATNHTESQKAEIAEVLAAFE